MRIVGGNFRGRKLLSPHGRAIRPTSDRVREAIFNILGPLQGQTALDLYAGTGAMGLEAHSRGADKLVFIDIDRVSVDHVLQNLDLLGLAPGPLIHVRQNDATAALEDLANEKYVMDVVFVDPPYLQCIEQLLAIREPLLAVCDRDTQIVVEASARDEREVAELLMRNWKSTLVRRRRYGDSVVFLVTFEEIIKED